MQLISKDGHNVLLPITIAVLDIAIALPSRPLPVYTN